MVGKRSRTKGHSYERKVADAFRNVGYEKACRKLEYQLADCDGVDLKNTGPFRVQCKRYKDYAPISKIEEIQDPTGIPLLITKGDRKPDMVVMKAQDFFEMLGVLRGVYEREKHRVDQVDSDQG